MEDLQQDTTRLQRRARCSSRLFLDWLCRMASCVPSMAGHTVSAKSIARDMMTFWASPARTALRIVSRTSSKYFSRKV